MKTQSYYLIFYVILITTSKTESLFKNKADEGYMLVIQSLNEDNIKSDSCTETCQKSSMICDFEGIDHIPQPELNRMLKELLRGHLCQQEDSTLTTVAACVNHDSDVEPTFNYNNDCTSKYNNIGGKGVLPRCETRINDNAFAERICRCRIGTSTTTTKNIAFSAIETSANVIKFTEYSKTSSGVTHKTASTTGNKATDSPKKSSNPTVVIVAVLLLLVLLLLLVMAIVLVVRRKRRRRKPFNAIGTAKMANPSIDRATDAKSLISTNTVKSRTRNSTKSKTAAKSEKTIASTRTSKSRKQSSGKAGGSKKPFHPPKESL